MGDTSVKKVEARHSPRGEMGQKYLASGVRVSMRLWEEEQPAEPAAPVARDYETPAASATGATYPSVESAAASPVATER